MRAMLILLSLMLVSPAFAQHGRPGGGHPGPQGGDHGHGWDHGDHHDWDHGGHGWGGGWGHGPGWDYGGFYWRCQHDFAFHALHLGECGF